MDYLPLTDFEKLHIARNGKHRVLEVDDSRRSHRLDLILLIVGFAILALGQFVIVPNL